MNRVRSLLYLLLVVVLTGWCSPSLCPTKAHAQTASPASPKSAVGADIWLSPDLGLSGNKSINAALSEPLEDNYTITLGTAPHQTTAILHNCKDYLHVEKSSYDAGPAVVSNVLHYEGARCDALDLLRSARPALHPAFYDFSFKHILSKDLPASLALLVNEEQQQLAERIDRRGGSIVDLEKVALHPRGPYEAELVATDWTATLTVLARADFLGDGNEELLIRRNVAAIGGTLRSTTVFLLARSLPAARLRIVTTRP